MNSDALAAVHPAMISHLADAITSVRSRRRRAVALGSIALALAAAGCSSAGASGHAAASSPTVRVGSTAMGPVLENAAGLTLYAFSADSASTIVCQTTCTPIWPPLVVAAGAKPVGGSGVTGTLGTVTRPDGSHQVTYNGLLLYSYAGDGSPGQTKGQGIVEQYGSAKGTWSVVTPTSAATTAASTGQGSAGSGTSGASSTTTTQGSTGPNNAGALAPGNGSPPATFTPPTTSAPSGTVPAPTTTAPPAPTTTAPPPTTTTTTAGTWA